MLFRSSILNKIVANPEAYDIADIDHACIDSSLLDAPLMPAVNNNEIYQQIMNIF